LASAFPLPPRGATSAHGSEVRPVPESSVAGRPTTTRAVVPAETPDSTSHPARELTAPTQIRSAPRWRGIEPSPNCLQCSATCARTGDRLYTLPEPTGAFGHPTVEWGWLPRDRRFAGLAGSLGSSEQFGPCREARLWELPKVTFDGDVRFRHSTRTAPRLRVLVARRLLGRLGKFWLSTRRGTSGGRTPFEAAGPRRELRRSRSPVAQLCVRSVHSTSLRTRSPPAGVGPRRSNSSRRRVCGKRPWRLTNGSTNSGRRSTPVDASSSAQLAAGPSSGRSPARSPPSGQHQQQTL